MCYKITGMRNCTKNPDNPEKCVKKAINRLKLKETEKMCDKKTLKMLMPEITNVFHEAKYCVKWIKIARSVRTLSVILMSTLLKIWLHFKKTPMASTLGR